jgi:hypothetical protein
VDALVRLTGPVNLLPGSAGLCVAGALMVWVSERALRPAPRAIRGTEAPGVASAMGGLREVARSRYLLLIVGCPRVRVRGRDD